MKKLLLLVLMILALSSVPSAAEENTGEAQFSQDETPKCYVFYHNEADNEWDFYCTK